MPCFDLKFNNLWTEIAHQDTSKSKSYLQLSRHKESGDAQQLKLCFGNICGDTEVTIYKIHSQHKRFLV